MTSPAALMTGAMLVAGSVTTAAWATGSSGASGARPHRPAAETIPTSGTSATLEESNGIPEHVTRHGRLTPAQAKALADRLRPLKNDPARIDEAYSLLFSRPPSEAERKLGLEFLSTGGDWPQYAQALFSSNEFSFVE